MFLLIEASGQKTFLCHSRGQLHVRSTASVLSYHCATTSSLDTPLGALQGCLSRRQMFSSLLVVHVDLVRSQRHDFWVSFTAWGDLVCLRCFLIHPVFAGVWTLPTTSWCCSLLIAFCTSSSALYVLPLATLTYLSYTIS